MVKLFYFLLKESRILSKEPMSKGCPRKKKKTKTYNENKLKRNNSPHPPKKQRRQSETQFIGKQTITSRAFCLSVHILSANHLVQKTFGI